MYFVLCRGYVQISLVCLGVKFLKKVENRLCGFFSTFYEQCLKTIKVETGILLFETCFCQNCLNWFIQYNLTNGGLWFESRERETIDLMPNYGFCCSGDQLCDCRPQDPCAFHGRSVSVRRVGPKVYRACVRSYIILYMISC